MGMVLSARLEPEALLVLGMAKQASKGAWAMGVHW